MSATPDLEFLVHFFRIFGPAPLCIAVVCFVKSSPTHSSIPCPYQEACSVEIEPDVYPRRYHLRAAARLYQYPYPCSFRDQGSRNTVVKAHSDTIAFLHLMRYWVQSLTMCSSYCSSAPFHRCTIVQSIPVGSSNLVIHPSVTLQRSCVSVGPRAVTDQNSIPMQSQTKPDFGGNPGAEGCLVPSSVSFAANVDGDFQVLDVPCRQGRTKNSGTVVTWCW